MSLAAALKAESEIQRGPSCSVGKALAEMEADDAQAFNEALGGPMQSSAITRALKSIGVDIAEQTVARHRRGRCRCSQ